MDPSKAVTYNHYSVTKLSLNVRQCRMSLQINKAQKIGLDDKKKNKYHFEDQRDVGCPLQARFCDMAKCTGIRGLLILTTTEHQSCRLLCDQNRDIRYVSG